MNTRRIALHAFLLTLAALTQPAMAQSSACPMKPIWVVFVNGIQNSPNDASSSIVTLQNHHWDLVGANEPTQYALVYNPKGTLSRDILEAAYQSLPQYGAANLTELFESLFGLRPANEVLQNALRAKLAGLASLANIPQEAAVIRQAHAAIYGQLLAGTSGQGLTGEAGGIVTVAHSQGNLFANLTYSDIPDKARLRVVSVATPDDHVGGSGPYFTAQEDLFAQMFIAARQLAGLGTLSPNTSLGSLSQISLANMLGHSFEKAYLTAPATELEIISAVESARQSIGYAPQNPAACNPPPTTQIIVPIRTEGRTLAMFQCTLATPDCPPLLTGASQTEFLTTQNGILHAEVPFAVADLSYSISISNSVDQARLILDITGAMGGIGPPIGPTTPSASGPVRRYPYTEVISELLSDYLITLPETPPFAHSQVFYDITSEVERSEFDLGVPFSFGGNEPGASEYRCLPLGRFGPSFDTPGTIDTLGSNGSGSFIIGPGSHTLSIHPEAKLRLRSGFNDVTPLRFGDCRFNARVDIRIFTNHLTN
jgi:hypothetical protein